MDGIGDVADNAPFAFNPTQANADGDNFGDAADNAPTAAWFDLSDTDGDGIGDIADTDPLDPNVPGPSTLTVSAAPIAPGQTLIIDVSVTPSAEAGLGTYEEMLQFHFGFTFLGFGAITVPVSGTAFASFELDPALFNGPTWDLSTAGTYDFAVAGFAPFVIAPQYATAVVTGNAVPEPGQLGLLMTAFCALIAVAGGRVRRAARHAPVTLTLT
jgi:hypothetical protein